MTVARGLEQCKPSTSGRSCSGFRQSCGQGRRHRENPSYHCRAKLRTHHPEGKPLIKICGVTSPEDAELAAKSGADFVGTILWQGARRAVSLQTAAKISETAERYGAQPVAVFVDEDFADIVRACKQAGIKIAQLHGRGARSSLHDLPNWLKVVYVLHAGSDGLIQTKDLHSPLGDTEENRQVDWLLLDGLKGGSGETYDWRQLTPPILQEGMQGWLLAGGLTPDNVGQAVRLAKPTGVDVSSGVTGPDGLRKDPQKVFRFVEEVRRAAAHV